MDGIRPVIIVGSNPLQIEEFTKATGAVVYVPRCKKVCLGLSVLKDDI